MPGYKTHDKIGIGVTPVIAGASIYLGNTTEYTVLLVTGFILSTYLLSPDLDLNSRIYRRWGLLRFIWLPYQKVIHHRSWLSHSGPVSATIRLAYLLLLLTPVLYIAHIDLLTLIPWCVIMWLSISLSDTIHVIADRVWRD